MERSDSVTSHTSGTFAYQARLLERTSSTSRGLLSRSNSQSSNVLNNNNNGEGGGARKWTPSHRSNNSVDAVRGKWEERAREAAEDDQTYYGKAARPTLPPATGLTRTPTYLKRQTLPAPIIASPLSPNTTGVSVEADSPLSPLSNRIHLPSARYQRSQTLDSSPPTVTTTRFNDASAPSPAVSSVRRRPTSFSGPSPDKLPQRSMFEKSLPPAPGATQSPVLSSVMTPPVYRSSYVANKKYGDTLTAGRRLGQHLPRIASGDGNEEPMQEEPDVHMDLVQSRRERRERRARELAEEQERRARRTRDLFVPSAANLDDVAGVPGRLRLSRDKSAPSTPLPTSKLNSVGRGLWADVQRHLMQAYEYLCHVGEAQQWIEGCLNEELGFGVVEMDEGLRNGVVLAKLVRAFRGDETVRKIYEAPKLDFRHSDNINVFFTYVREVGLPECFIFELTDLYNKKNIPKVIYCIHALSHLLARRGLAQRIGNLLGRLEFSDEQLQQTQKGLKDSGVAMPNFGSIGRELAKEINEEEIETEDERRDRLLLENESSVIKLQSQCRGYLARRAQRTFQGRMRLAERHVAKFQARCRGAIVRHEADRRRQSQQNLQPWVIALQTSVRGSLVRRHMQERIREIRRSSRIVVKVQAQIRGVLQRRRHAKMRAALRTTAVSITKLQAAARARMTRNSHKQVTKSFVRTPVQKSIVALQAEARGVVARRNVLRLQTRLRRQEPYIVALQSHCRGLLTRRKMRAKIRKLEDSSRTVIRIQAACRTFLARKRLLILIRGLRKATPMVIALQAKARANLKRQTHLSLNEALGEAKTIKSVGGFQALARAKLARNRHEELHHRMEFATPDVVGFQAYARGALVRQDYHAWREHIWGHEHIATLLQALLRGALFRKNFKEKMEYYRGNLSKVVKIQSLFRAKETREQYRQLTLGSNVTVGTIKNFVHLLDDSETDFQDEIKVERLRKRVVESIRENQILENDVNELDVKIALVVQNVKSFEDVMKSRWRNTDTVASRTASANLLAAHGDPFSGTNTADHQTRRKLELYQQLFYLIQTHGEYLSRLFVKLSTDDAPEKDRRFVERVSLNIFGYGQDQREDYLLLKLFQISIRDEVDLTASIDKFLRNHPMYIGVALHYVRPKQVTYVRETLQTIIRELINADDLDLEADPTTIHRARIDIEEMRTGRSSAKPKDVSFREALQDPETRAIYIRHLQLLQWWTEAFVNVIVQSTKRMPYGMRFLVRETLQEIRRKYPQISDVECASCIGRIVFYRYLNPAIITPEAFDIISQTVDVGSRKNLGQISRVLTQITSGLEFDDDNPCYVPINDLVRKAMAQLSAWFLDIANIPDAETQFHAHEFLDATVQPKPIYISPNEIYTMHSLLSQNKDYLAPNEGDPLRIILSELGGVPLLTNDELKDARDFAITLELTNRFADVRDPHADEKALWVKAKRGVLAILRVQPAQDLVDSLMRPVTEEDEIAWEDILDAEMESEHGRRHPGRQASQAAGESAYRLEDIRALRFGAVKALAISYLLELEKLGKISRADGFQGILTAIALDVRSKHRKRLQRQQEMDSMNEALKQLAERKKYFEEQINSYNSYVETAMNTMQRGGKGGKKRFTIPFTKQYFHERELQRSGQLPQFGSFIYTAKHLYDKNILLSIDQYSPRQFDKLHVTMSSNLAGVFTIILESTLYGPTSRIASEDIKMENLLQAKYEKKSSLTMMNGIIKFNFENFLFQINKKFYV